MNTLRPRHLAVGLLALAAAAAPALAQQAPTQPSLYRFNGPIDRAASDQLAAEGTRLLHYYGDGLYLVSQPTKLGEPAGAQRRSTLGLQRLDPVLREARAQRVGDRLEVDLVLAYPGAADALRPELEAIGFSTAAEQIEGGVTIAGSLPADALEAALALPFVTGATPRLANDQPLNLEARIAQGVTPVNSGIAGAPNLNGDGVVIGVGDGGYLGGHPDIADRVVASTTYYNAAWGAHPDMVAGIIAGAGVVDPTHRGVACEAELVVEPTSTITYQAVSRHADYGMTITNSSYGPSFSCSTAGRYYGGSVSMDQQLFDNPALLHVYAAGNSGANACGTAPQSYGTIVAGPQTAKNTLSVANLDFDREVYLTSSSGPTFDGRIKPEIAAIGMAVTSPTRADGYAAGSGTSFSAPGVAGVLGLLTQRYRQLFPSSDPDGALLKALACNTAEDLGAAGPDYRYGFGLVDGRRALHALETGSYAQSTLAAGGTFTQGITVAAGQDRLDVLLYWPDRPGANGSEGATLVHDFDLTLVSPAGDTLRPWILDPANPTNAATTGTDRVNNIEQVSVAGPAAGTYTLVVRGYDLPYGASPFVVTWDQVAPEVVLTCPYGGETLRPGEGAYLAWDATDSHAGAWTLAYRDAAVGGAWTTIASGLAAETRSYAWTVPTDVAEVELRVTNDASGGTDVTDASVTLIGTPDALTTERVCDGSVGLEWASVAGASAYRVYRFDGAEMVALATTADTTHTVGGLTAGEAYLFSVTAVSAATGAEGQRAYAKTETSEVDGPGCRPLPVTWLGLSTEELGDAVRVSWSVGTQVDNAGFELMRGTPLGDTLGWEAVVYVAGDGTRAGRADFSAEDAGAAPQGVTYYRVRQLDADGRVDYSAVVAHERAAASSTSGGTRLAVAAELTGGRLRVDVPGVRALTARLSDLAGRTLAHLTLEPGRRDYPITSSPGAAVYLLHGEAFETLRVVGR